MKSRGKILTSITSVMLSVTLLITFVLFSNRTNNATQTAATRTVELSQSALDVQSIFDEFEDTSLIKDGSTVCFEGYKSIDSTVLSDADYISESDIENLENCVVKYNFSYDTETNIVTISALATLQDGTVQVDEITGVGFLNDKNEIDAVMNIDGEGILLSEMRNVGVIENCSWFSKIIKSVAKAVVVVAVAAVAVAAIVVTAGTAAPAVVAAGVGVSTTVVSGMVATAATIGAYASITAAIAAGVAITANMVDSIDWNGIKYDVVELTDSYRYNIRNDSYYLAIATVDGKMLITSAPVTDFVAMTAARGGLSVYTYRLNNALTLAQTVNYGFYPTYHNAHGRGMGYFNHYHVYKANQTSHIFYGAPVL